MKLAKLSLAAMVVAGLASSSFAASDTLADAFKNGKVKGELKAWYFDKDTNEAQGTTKTIDGKTFAYDGKEDIADFAIELGYVTDSLNGFRLGATFQGAATPFASDEAKILYNDSQYAPGAVLSEAYLGYAIGKTDVKVGRQYIATPLVNGSGSRIYKEAFEGAVLVNTDIPQTTVAAGYVGKFQGRTGTISNFGTQDDGAPTFKKAAVFTGAGSTALAFDGAYTGLVINKSITNLALTGQYAVVNDVVSGTSIANVSVYYAEANYVLPVAGFKLGFDVNARGSRTGAQLDVAQLEGDYYAGRISISELAGFGASFAAGITSDDQGVIAGMGNGPTSYTSTMIRGTSKVMTADTDSYLFAATYDFGKIGVTGLSAIAQYGWTEQGQYKSKSTALPVTSTVDNTNIAVGLAYDVQAAALKGLSVGLQYETQTADTKTYTGTNVTRTTSRDTDELWFKAGYKF
ncbi:OprD family outer membrane porin [Sulfurospirillum arsenophilum]|uniref:OprD family outer membrane porin n=1 Tax=Sulfurospirillum arsenophilum TaxID=56698 RepID=UPI0005A9A178|nr:OprD family outer membrane porin [Sulfurospirillum arsenophilum]